MNIFGRIDANEGELKNVDGHYVFQGTRLTQIAHPEELDDAVPKHYVDEGIRHAIESFAIKRRKRAAVDEAGVEYDYDLEKRRLKNIGAAEDETDAVSKTFVETELKELEEKTASKSFVEGELDRIQEKYEELRETIDSKRFIKDDLDKLQEKLNTLKDALKADTDSKSFVEGELVRIEKKYEELREAIDSKRIIKDDLDKLQKELNALKEAIKSDMDARVKEHRAELEGKMEKMISYSDGRTMSLANDIMTKVNSLQNKMDNLNTKTEAIGNHSIFRSALPEKQAALALSVSKQIQSAREHAETLVSTVRNELKIMLETHEKKIPSGLLDILPHVGSTGNYNFHNKLLRKVGKGTAPTDVVNKEQLDEVLKEVKTHAGSLSLEHFNELKKNIGKEVSEHFTDLKKNIDKEVREAVLSNKRFNDINNELKLIEEKIQKLTNETNEFKKNIVNEVREGGKANRHSRVIHEENFKNIDKEMRHIKEKLQTLTNETNEHKKRTDKTESDCEHAKNIINARVAKLEKDVTGAFRASRSYAAELFNKVMMKIHEDEFIREEFRT